MSSPVVAPGGSGNSARRGSGRAHILALVAIVCVVVLIDSEVLAFGISSIAAVFDMLHLPTVAAYAAMAALGLLTLWLSVALARRVWHVEHALDAARQGRNLPLGC
jgi:hypothetical protein